jgi:HD superfamily phosphodiesterase
MVEATPATLTKAKNHLTIGFESQVIAHIEKCETAIEIWEKLAAIYGDADVYRRSGTLKDFVKLELEDCDGIQDYIDLKVSLANQITSIGFVIDENRLGESLLMGH